MNTFPIYAVLSIQSAVNRDTFAGDVGGIIGGKESYEGSYFFGRTETVHGYSLFEFRLLETVRHVGSDKSGGNGIDGDILFRHLFGKRFGSGNESAFRCRVVTLSGQTGDAGEGSDIDDASVSMAYHRRKEGSCDVIEREEVRSQHCFEIIGLHPHQEIIPTDTGVVDQHVDIVLGMR